ncbi:MAG: L-fucose/L-arabinose isomerase family protein [Armatimonadota bacterium]
MAATPLLGLAPIGKFVFSHEDAMRIKRELQQRLTAWGVRYVDLDGVIPDGMVRDQAHVDSVVEHLKGQGIDALFLPHCNFGTEGAAGMIARKLGVPTLLWGPRDEAPLEDGKRLRDSLCGLFASSKVLHKLGVPFTYIENCRIDDAPLREGMDRFLRAAHVAAAFRKGIKIGHIGQRIDFFWTTIINESELLERFKVEVLPIDLVQFIRHAKDHAAANAAAYAQEVKRLRAEMDFVNLDDDTIARILAVRDQMLAVAADNGLDGLAVQDFDSLVEEIGAYCFLANSMVSDTVPVSLESDIHGAISNILLHRAACGDPVFLVDVTIRHPQDDNGILLWHAGAPLSMAAPGARVEVGHHWILPSPLSGMPHFPLRGGPLTVARFDGDHGEYQLAIGEGESMDGPYTRNNYLWMQVDNWPRWERLLMEGPFIHHTAMAYGRHADALREACKYLPGVEALTLNEAPANVTVKCPFS